MSPAARTANPPGFFRRNGTSLAAIVGLAIVLYVHFGRAKEETSLANWPNPYTPITVAGKTFRNEVVPLDGYEYINCEFDNVKLLYNGTTPIKLQNNHFNVFPIIKTDSDAVSGAVMLLVGLGIAHANLLDLNPTNVIEPPLVAPDAQK